MYSQNFSGKDLIQVKQEDIERLGVSPPHAQHILAELDKLRYTTKPLSMWRNVEVVAWLASLSKVSVLFKFRSFQHAVTQHTTAEKTCNHILP